ncbi:hypothetical protein [Streptomyces cavernicola]|uniref:Uncharacterized protein n=1 Tax=Streptomyces cavernicola TaxID=3043613 RepID=A0ABT6SBJ9_9ACTN|nr:hypothetical protein [Streptomyces sp. B-S-A6]MDI3405568.1 hypothetical protein [Streptomyces sp. B-S-A6]
MRFRTCQRAAVLLLIVASLQSGATALADGKGPGGQGASKTAPVDPLAPFSQGASALAGMAAPFVNAASDAMFPRR